MNYCVVNESNIIANIVVAEPDVAEQMGFLFCYEELRIGDEYIIPKPEEPEEEINPDEDTVKYMDKGLTDGINDI